MTDARLTEQELAEACKVDIKTVARWVTEDGRLPHPRHRWAASEALGVDAAVLWPESIRKNVKTGADVLTGTDRENQETSMLALHLLQSALVFVNTILVQSVLKDPEWAGRLTDADRRALSPLFWSHANLYGTIEIDMDTHLDLGLAA